MGKNGKDKRAEMWKLIKKNNFIKEYTETVGTYQKTSGDDMESFLADKAALEIDGIVNNFLPAPVEFDGPIMAEPVPTVQEPIPTVQEPIPTVQEPIPTVQEPIPTIKEPIPTIKEPIQTVVAPDDEKVNEYANMYTQSDQVQGTEYVKTEIEDILQDALNQAESNIQQAAPGADANQYTDDKSRHFVSMVRDMVMPCPVCHSEMDLNENKGVWVCPNCGENPTLANAGVSQEEQDRRMTAAANSMGMKMGPSEGSLSHKFRNMSPDELARTLGKFKSDMPDDMLKDIREDRWGDMAEQPGLVQQQQQQSQLQSQLQSQAPKQQINKITKEPEPVKPGADGGLAGAGGDMDRPIPGVGTPLRKKSGFIPDKGGNSQNPAGGVLPDKDVGVGAESEFGIKPLPDPANKPDMVTGKKGMVRKPVNYDQFINPNSPEGVKNYKSRGNRGHRTVTEEQEARGLKPLPPTLYDEGRHAPNVKVQNTNRTVVNNRKHRRAVGPGGAQRPIRPPGYTNKTFVDGDGVERPIPPPPPGWEGEVNSTTVADYEAQDREHQAQAVRGGPPQRREWVRGDAVQTPNITKEARDGTKGMPGGRRKRKARGRKIIRH